MHSNARVCKYLPLTTQLFWKFPGIRIATDKFPHCCQFYITDLPLRIDSINASKQIAITSTALGLQYKDKCSYFVHQTFEVNSVPRRSFHISTENIPQSISSSTITTTTTTEDITVAEAKMAQFVVNHDTDRKHFYIKLQEASSDQQEVLAKLEYEWVGPGLVDMYHTEVPPQFQGQGIAKVLATGAFDALIEQGVQFRPTCTYLRKYLRDNPNPRYLDHIEKGFVL
ncbi:hypothetical protein BsWGS_03981 [Bradybaena similaris]